MRTFITTDQGQRDKGTGEPDEAISFKSGSEEGWGKRPAMDLARSLSSTPDPRCTAVVGWDNPLTTFFAQIFNASIADDDEACVLWIGTAPEAIPTVAALQAQLAGWAAIPPDIVDRLVRDQQAATPPTPLQQWAHQLLHDAGEPGPDRA